MKLLNVSSSEHPLRFEKVAFALPRGLSGESKRQLQLRVPSFSYLLEQKRLSKNSRAAVLSAQVSLVLSFSNSCFSRVLVLGAQKRGE